MGLASPTPNPAHPEEKRIFWPTVKPEGRQGARAPAEQWAESEMMTRESSEKAKGAERVGWQTETLASKCPKWRCPGCFMYGRGRLARSPRAAWPGTPSTSLYRRFPELNPDCEARSSMKEWTPKLAFTSANPRRYRPT